MKRINKKADKTYFLTNGKGQVKIGCSSDPEKRLSIIQPGNPYRLKIALVLDTNREKELHKKFAKYKNDLIGEWFSNEGELLEFIENSQIK